MPGPDSVAQPVRRRQSSQFTGGGDMQTDQTTAAGLTAKDLKIGQIFTTGSICLSAEDITSFARDFDPQPFHLDAEAAKQTFFKTLVASGWHVLAVTMKLMVDARLFGGTPLIGAEINNIRFHGPVRPGTSMRVRATVEALSDARNPKYAYADLLLETLNTDAEEVLVSQQLKFIVPRG